MESVLTGLYIKKEIGDEGLGLPLLFDDPQGQNPCLRFLRGSFASFGTRSSETNTSLLA